MAPYGTHSGFVPPLGRVSTWKTSHSPGCPAATYVIVQVPRNPGPLASMRIASALRRGLQAGAKGGLYVVLTDLVKLVRR